MQLLTELKRRNVFRVAGLYLVGAWLMVQVAGTVLPMFAVPDWVARAIVVVLAIGFIPALMMAWVFELTPEGLKRDTGAAPGDAVRTSRSQRMDRLIVVALLALVVLMAAERFWNRAPATPAVATPAGDAAPAAEPAALALGIGVLPFDNLSPDPENAFFASGIHEEVLTRLAQLHDVRVISRTSMENIAAEDLAVPDIGRRLGVSHVMEGSVRRAGDKVRITVQLIEAATDKHLWAENYDRTLEDVFAVQSEIALAIAGQLEIALTPSAQGALQELPTRNAEAYELYLRAMAEKRIWRGTEGFRTLITLLEPAIALDPEFAQARVVLAEAYGRIYWLGEDPDGSFLAKARAQVDQLEKRSPDGFHTRHAQALIAYLLRDYPRALGLFQALAAEQPNNSEILLFVSSALKRQSRYPEQLAALRQALSVDPESPTLMSELVLALAYNGKYPEALAQDDELLRRYPEDPAIVSSHALNRLRFGGDRAPILAFGSYDDFGSERAAALFSEGDVDAAVADLRQLQAEGVQRARLVAEQAHMLRLAGRDEEAKPLARRALVQVREWTASDAARTDGMRGFWYAMAAAIAAIADERELATAWMAKAKAEPALGDDLKELVASEMVVVKKWTEGDDAAWAEMAVLPLPHPWLRGLKGYHDAMFGDSAAYQAYMAKIGAK